MLSLYYYYYILVLCVWFADKMSITHTGRSFTIDSGMVSLCKHTFVYLVFIEVIYGDVTCRALYANIDFVISVVSSQVLRKETHHINMSIKLYTVYF